MRLVQVGNSMGVRIPKAIINQAGLEDCELEMRVVDDGLLLVPVKSAREGWHEVALTAAKDDDATTIEGSNEFDNEEWTW
ncbi:MAG: AbrB/MazE/SpoVT family DNA-binding domain-containing protein [Magnetococcales bacterium]|nr:AbrB/MazE/SpoVT family DNA-binding domain-containing protein [Magnetococcales bacterium]